MPNEQEGKRGQNQGPSKGGDDKRREAAPKAGGASSGNFKNDPQRALEARSKGGESPGGNQGGSRGRS